MRRFQRFIFAFFTWIAILCGQQKPYVVLLSLDGFRFDYAERYQAENLLSIARNGVHAKAMIPSYRTNTFPNHYSIATGLYPAHHGIVDNNFYDADRKDNYANSRPESGGDGSWYGGVPLWVLAEQQGIKAAAYFYPATDAEIQGRRPSYFSRYDGKVPNATRVDQVLAWLALPEAERPHFIALYFSDTDDDGHTHGPDTPETGRAVARMDEQIGRLRAGFRATGLPIDFFVVSDHGMLATNPPISVGKATDFVGLTANPAAGAQIMLYSADKALIEITYRRLKTQSRAPNSGFHVYRRNETPARLHYRGNPRIGDLVLMASTPAPIGIEQPGRPLTTSKGAHGFDPKLFPQMRAIFYAEGPGLRAGLTLKPFENVHIYPLIAELLGLKIPSPIDGRLSVLREALR